MAQRQLSNGIRYISVASELRKSVSFMDRILDIKLLADFYSTADISTTSGQTSILFVGGYWARCQLCNSIRYTSVAAKLRISLFFVLVVLRGA